MTFHESFAANMHALGLPAPQGIFESAATTIATIDALNTAIIEHGHRAITLRALLTTVPQLAHRAAVGKLAAVATGVMAAYYVGACIESLMVATDQQRTLASRLQTANRLGVRAPWLLPTFTELAARAAARLR